MELCLEFDSRSGAESGRKNCSEKILATPSVNEHRNKVCEKTTVPWPLFQVLDLMYTKDLSSMRSGSRWMSYFL